MQPPERFTTDRLVLRRAHQDDAQALFDAYASDPQATRYLAWRTHEVVAHTRELLERAEATWADGSELTWVLVPRDGSDPIGTLGAVPGPHGVEIGYALGPQWWGRGLMVEAVTAIMRWWQEQQDVYRIWAYCAVDHHQSARVLERSGMTYEGTLRRWVTLPNFADEPIDALVFAWVRSATGSTAASRMSARLERVGKPRATAAQPPASVSEPGSAHRAADRHRPPGDDTMQGAWQ